MIPENIDFLLRTWLDSLSFEGHIDAVNIFRKLIRDYSPFQNNPVDCVLWVPVDRVCLNDYNPNVMLPAEAKLLRKSLLRDGYTQPIVVCMKGESYEVIDGAHRFDAARKNRAIREKCHGHVPVVCIDEINHSRKDKMASTIRHNRARGKHKITGMVDLVRDLSRQGWSDLQIGEELGMDQDEVLRLKQISGLTELFADAEFSMSWTIE